MAGMQQAAADLKSRSARLTEYSGLVENGFDSPEALQDAREETLVSIPLRRAAVDAVLAWQQERKSLGELLSM